MEQSRRDGSQMFWAPVGCRRKGDELIAWQWVGYVHGTRSAVITRERTGSAHLVYAAKRYVGRFAWLSDARDAAMFAASEVPYLIIDLVTWLVALVKHHDPASAGIAPCIRKPGTRRLQLARVASA